MYKLNKIIVFSITVLIPFFLYSCTDSNPVNSGGIAPTEQLIYEIDSISVVSFGQWEAQGFGFQTEDTTVKKFRAEFTGETNSDSSIVELGFQYASGYSFFDPIKGQFAINKTHLYNFDGFEFEYYITGFGMALSVKKSSNIKRVYLTIKNLKVYQVF